MNDDSLLLSQLEQGNEDAFNTLYEKYWGKAYSEAYKRLKDYNQAKDIVQEIFIHIWLKREVLHIENLPAYLNRAVRNRVFKLIEKQKYTHPFFSLLENIPASFLQADANLLYQEFLKSYEALLATLPTKRQIIFRMRFQDDLSTKAIADQLNISRKTVQNQLGKAVDQLRSSILNLFAILIVLSSFYH